MGIGIIAWGYAAWCWWRTDPQPVFVRDSAPHNEGEQPVLAAGDLLVAVDLPTELTPDDEAVIERASLLIGLAREEWPTITLDGKSRTPVTAQVMKEFTAWVHDLYVDSFNRCAEEKAPWRSAASQWLEEYLAGATDRERRPSLRDAGKQLIDSGCDDRLIRYCVFRCHDKLDEAEQAAEAVKILQPLDSLSASGYPPAITYRIYLAHADAVARTVPGQPVGLKQAMDDFAAAISEPLTEAERRFHAIRFRADMRGVLRQYVGQLVGRLQAASSADRWFVNLIQATWHFERGWQARGGDYASAVTEAGWAGFGAHLNKARILFLRCWEEHPDCPDAATELIAVTMGIGGIAGEDPGFWFGEAVAAQFDVQEAYARLRWALRPRWGGSHAAMLAFGRECLATERFDTDVPWQFHQVLKEIASELDDRRAVYRLAGVYDDYQRLLAGYRARNDVTPAEERRFDTRSACVAWLAGRDAEAREMLTKLGDEVVPTAFADFDTTQGEVRRTLYDLPERPAIANAAFQPGVEFVNISNDGHRLLVGSMFSGAQVADTTRGCDVIATLSPAAEEAFRGFCLSPQGTTLITIPMPMANQLDTPSILIWDVETQSKLRDLTAPAGTGVPFIATFSPDGRYVAAGGVNGRLMMWDVSSERVDPVCQSGTGHSGAVFGLAFSGDGRRLVTVGADFRALIWDIAETSPDTDFTASQSITIDLARDKPGSICLSPKGDRLLIGGTNVALWDLAAKRELFVFGGACANFAPDGRRFATGGGELGTEGRVWDADSGKELVKLIGGHAREISIVVFSNDGRRILTGSSDPNREEPGYVRCWDAESGEEVFDFSGLK